MFKVRKSRRFAYRTYELDKIICKTEFRKSLRAILSDTEIRETGVTTRAGLNLLSFRNKFRNPISWILMKEGYHINKIWGCNKLRCK